MLSSAYCRAELGAAQITTTKQATALVLSVKSGLPIGTAFCIDPKGYFLTSLTVAEQHVAGSLTLVLEPGGKNERKLPARVVRTRAEQHLALLKCDVPSDKALLMHDQDALKPGAQVTAFGYPSQGQPSEDPRARPDITVLFGLVLERMVNAEKVIQIVIQGNPSKGHSGGPILNDEGRVVGVIVSCDTHVHAEAPLGAIRAFLNEPVLRADFPEAVPWADRHKPLRLKTAVDVVSARAPHIETALTLIDEVGERVLTGKEETSGFFFEAPLIPRPDPSRVWLRLRLPNTILTCMAEDRALSCADGSHLLSELAGYDRDRGFSTRGGKTLPCDGRLGSLTVYPTTKPHELPMRVIEGFEVMPNHGSPFVRYRLSALSQGIRAVREGEIRFTDMPGRTVTPIGPDDAHAETAPAIQAHEPFATITEDLPAPVTDIVQAGRGRYLLLLMPRVEQLAIYDVAALKVIKTIPLPDPKTLVAGGASSFVMVHPQQEVIQRIQLETFACDQIEVLPASGAVMQIAMGYASEGPLSVRTARAFNRFGFFDLQTLKPHPDLSHVTPPLGLFYDPMTFRASADGSTLAVRTAVGSHIDVLRIAGSTVTRETIKDHVGYLVPGPKGAYLYTYRGIYTHDLTRVGSGADIFRIPSTLAPYYLRAEPMSKFRDKQNQVRLTLFVADGDQPVIALPETPELTMSAQPSFSKGMPFDKRVHYVPQARVLVTVPARGRRVVTRYVALEARLKVAGLAYLFVDSLPIRQIERGARYRYQISARSHGPDVRYTLDTGPEGMQISRQGLLSWQVPKHYTGQAYVAVDIRGGEGRALRHAFTIEVVP